MIPEVASLELKMSVLASILALVHRHVFWAEAEVLARRAYA